MLDNRFKENAWGINIRANIYRADEYVNSDSLATAKERTDNLISELTGIISDLQEYRSKLDTQEEQLKTAKKVRVIRLERKVDYFGDRKISYTIKHCIKFPQFNNKEYVEKAQKYAGNERHLAIKDFKNFKIAYPDAEFEENIS